jgi:hypothetical protein
MARPGERLAQAVKSLVATHSIVASRLPESAGILLMEKETQQQRCPLCANPAEYRWVDSKNTKHFYCTHCGQFEISVDAQKRLEKGPNHRKLTLSQVAREHPYRYTLVIALPEDKELVSLCHKYVKNSDLPP